MKTHIFFNMKDKPENMGQSQLTDDIGTFLNERAELLPNPNVTKTKLTFDIVDGEETRRGYAILTEVDDDFENA